MRDQDGKLMSFPRVKTVHVFDVRHGGMHAGSGFHIPSGVEIALVVSEEDEEGARKALQMLCDGGAATAATMYVWHDLEQVVTKSTALSEQEILDVVRRLSKKNDAEADERIVAGMLARMPEAEPLKGLLPAGEAEP